MAANTQIEPIRKTVELACTQEHAWETFTQQLGTWWPLDKISLAMGQEGVTTVSAELEPRAGGRVFERNSRGEEGEWARVMVWEPPRRLVLAWHPGLPVDTELELLFTSLGPKRCRVELEHRGWEHFGEQAAQMRDSYFNGWPIVWDAFVAAAGNASGTALS
jgi:hypothetical protein